MEAIYLGTMAELEKRTKMVVLSREDFPARAEAVEENDIFVDILPDNLKKHFIAMIDFGDELQKKGPSINTKSLKFANRIVRKEATKSQLADIRQYTLDVEGLALFEEIFWQKLKEVFAERIAELGFSGRFPELRENWQVVICPSKSIVSKF